MEFEYGGKTYGIEIKKIGQEHCLPRKKSELRRKQYHSLHFVLHGFGTLHSGENKISLGRGNAFLLYANEEYTYYPNAVDPWSYIWVDFYGEELDGLFEACGFTREKPYVRMTDSAELIDLLKQLVEKYNGSDVQSMVCSAYTLLVFGRLIEYKNRYLKVSERGSVFFKQFRDIIDYINNNYRMNLTLEQIAEDMCVSERQLIYMFRSNIEMTPINYINKFRISNACELLKRDDLKVEEIAEMVGIEDEKYFTRMFTKWKGVSPREYRKICKDDDPFDWLKEKNIDFR